MDTHHNFKCDCKCNCNTSELPSFSSPFLDYGCPINPGTVNPFAPGSKPGDNELLLKDPVMRKRAFQNILDCGLYESQAGREVSKGPDYERASGSYYRAIHLSPEVGDVNETYCRTPIPAAFAPPLDSNQAE